jgi:hypothetical protein
MSDFETKRAYENQPRMTIQQGFVLCRMDKDENIIILCGCGGTTNKIELFFTKDSACEKAESIEDSHNLGVVEVALIVGDPQRI